MKMRDIKDKPRKNKAARYIPGALAGAAVCCLVLVLVITGIGRNNDNWSPAEDLPVLEFYSVNNLHVSTSKYAYDVSQLKTESPWTEDAEITHLPVYYMKTHNTMEQIDYPYSIQLTEEEMTAIAQDVVEKADLHAAQYQTHQSPNREGGSDDSLVIADCGDVSIFAFADGKVVWFSNERIPLSEYDYSFTKKSTTVPEAILTMKRFIEEFSPIIEMESPEIEIKESFESDGKHHLRYYLYEGAGEDLREKIINYSFSRMHFTPANDHGNSVLSSVRFTADRLWDAPVGEYPIITLEEAKEQLLQGDYISHVDTMYGDTAELSEDRIAYAELAYIDIQNGLNPEDYVMPCYYFYVELDDDSPDLAEGLTTYGIYVVPAVSSEYLNIDYNYRQPVDNWGYDFNQYREEFLGDIEEEPTEPPVYEYDEDSISRLPDMGVEELLEYFRCSEGIYLDAVLTELVDRFLATPVDVSTELYDFSMPKDQPGEYGLFKEVTRFMGAHAYFRDDIGESFKKIVQDGMSNPEYKYEVHAPVSESLYLAYLSPRSEILIYLSEDFFPEYIDLIHQGDPTALAEWMDHEQHGIDIYLPMANKIIELYSEFDLSDYKSTMLSGGEENGIEIVSFGLRDNNNDTLILELQHIRTPNGEYYFMPMIPSYYTSGD